MVQQLLTSIKITKKSSLKVITIFSLTVFLGFFLLFKNYRITDEKALIALENNIMQFSSLFSAIIITFIVTKVFQIRSERISNRASVISLSNKLTDFRRIAHIMLHRTEFWPTGMKSRMDNKYKDLSFADLYNHTGLSDTKRQLIDDFEKDNVTVGGNLYLDLRYLEGNVHLPESLLMFEDRDKNLIYSTIDLDVLAGLHIGGSVWYHLANEWGNYEGALNLTAFKPKEKERICFLASKIDKKFDGREFDRTLLAEVGTEMSEHNIPQLYELLLENTKPLPFVVKYLWILMVIVLMFGVLIPIILSALKIPENICSIFSALQASSLIIVIFFFILTFKRIVTFEIEVYD